MSSFLKKAWNLGMHAVNNFIDDMDDLLNSTGINHVVSYFAGLPDNFISNTTSSDTRLLNNDYKITAPSHQDLNNTPTIAQFLNAANDEYTIAGRPDNMHPFMVNGKQLAMMDEASDMYAKVWVTDKHQAIITFAGTSGGDNALINPLSAVTGFFTSDVQALGQTVSIAQKDALKFTQYAVHELELQGIDTNNTFLTGHSLGAIETSYVAQQTGLAGISFESTGIPDSANAHDGNNFLSVVTYGDPVAEYASDMLPDTAFVQAMDPGKNGHYNHYGHIVRLGDTADEVKLKTVYNQWNKGVIQDVAAGLDLVLNFWKYHQPPSQAKDMGMELSSYSHLVDNSYAAHGPVVPVANDTIGQYLSSEAHNPVMALNK